MTKIDIFSGFLGAGKTTLIKKLLREAYNTEKVVLIENEFGEIGIDSGFLQDAGIEITEMNSGCICCSLVGDFSKALGEVLERFKPDRVIIEPSGVGKLSDIIKAVKSVDGDGSMLNAFTTVADVTKCKMYMKNFGEFYNDQIANASCIVLSHADVASEEKTANAVKLIREHNPTATIVTTAWDKLDGRDILFAMEQKNTLEAEIEKMKAEHEHHHGEECHCHEHGHEHHHGEECHCHEHGHEHRHGEECHCHEHSHEHEHECTCGCHDHHHHHADEVFSSFGSETTRKFTKAEIENILEQFSEDDSYGMILRAKGIVECSDGQWIHFDYVPGEPDVRYGAAAVIGRLCVIGSSIDKEKIKEIFGL